MSGGGMNVNRESLVQRLQGLNVSQQSIEGTSKWCLFYIKDAKSVVNIWVEEFGRATSERRIAFLYLANHILQEGRKKGREFADEFFRVLPKALASVSRSSDTKLRNSAKRLVDIWDERKVFGSSQVRVLKEHLNGGGSGGGTVNKAGNDGTVAATDGTGGGGGGASSGNNELERRKLAAVGSLADVLYEVANAAARSSEWQTKCLQIKANVSSSDASMADVVAARTTLAAALEALKAESERRKKAVTYIRMHLSQQEDSLKRTEDAHSALVAQKAELDDRHAALLKQQQEQQEREKREGERELEAALKQHEMQQQQQQQQQQIQQQQQQQQVAMGGMGTDGGVSFLGMPPTGIPGMPPLMPPPFPLPGMDPTAPPFGLPGMPPFPAALLGPGAPPGMNPLAALAGAPGMNPLGPLPPFLGPMPGMNLNMPHPPGMNPMGNPGGPMNPMGGSGGMPGGGPMGQLPSGLPDLAGALTALSASGFGGSGGGGDTGASAVANGSQQPPPQLLQPQGTGLQPQSSGSGMPQGPGQLPPGPLPPLGLPHPHSGPGQQAPQPPPHGHPQSGAPPHHPAGGPGHHHPPGGSAGGGGAQPPPHPSLPPPAAGPCASSGTNAGPGASGPASAVAPPPLDPAGIDQLAAALANNSDQTAMLLANAFASMSQEERDRLGANLGDMLGSGGAGGPGSHPLLQQPQPPGHLAHRHPLPQHPHQSPQFPPSHHHQLHHHHQPQHHPLPPPQPADHGLSGGFSGSPMGNGDGDAMDAPYDPEFPD